MASLLPLLSMLALLTPGSLGGTEPADLILKGGRILTLADSGNQAIPTALAVKGDRIIFVGSDLEVAAFQGKKTRTIDLDGATVVPGFHDSHCHLYGLGKALAEVDLMGTATPEEVATRVAKANAELPSGQWLQGRGWDQNDWPVNEFPTRQLIDPVTGDRPAMLRRVDGHAALANTTALAMARITADTPDPEGGTIVRDKDGNPTGVLIDNAVDLVRDIIPEVTPSEVKRRILLAVDHCLSHGLTAVQDAGISWKRAQVYRELAAAEKLNLRVFGMFADEPATLDLAFAQGPVHTPDQMFTARAVKLYADGALGSRGALLHRDYCDHAGNRGLAVSSTEHMADVAGRAARAGFQVCTHAIGDRANTLVLNLYQEVLTREKPADPRWRIEHAQILTKTDIPRFSQLGVIAAMQPVHCTSDMDWAEDRLCADRLPGAYAWRSLLDSGAHLCWGTDFPVERVSPLEGLFSARTRTHHDGTPPGGWQPQETVDGQTALELYTRASAYSTFMEKELGQIKAGFLADLTVLNGDPVVCEPADLLGMKVLKTIVHGRVVYEMDP